MLECTEFFTLTLELPHRWQRLCEFEEFKNDMDIYMDEIKNTPPIPGKERVMYAGLPEHEEEIERRENGIPYHPEVIDWFRGITGELDITWRLTSD